MEERLFWKKKLKPNAKLARFWGGVLTVFLGASVFSPRSVANEENFIYFEDSEINPSFQVLAYTQINLPNGNTVKFVPLNSSGKRTSAVAMVEVVKKGTSETLSQLEGRNPVQMFHALSKPGTRIPKTIAKLYPNTKQLYFQGWARTGSAFKGDSQMAFNCEQGAGSWNSFRDEIEDFGFGNIFLSEADGPATEPQHWSSYGAADGNIWHRLTGRVHNASGFATSVSYCFEDHNIPANEQNARVKVSSRGPGESVWSVVASEVLADAGDRLDFVVANTGGDKVDFKLEISLAGDLDQFHIGATWSKPFTTIKAPN